MPIGESIVKKASCRERASLGYSGLECQSGIQTGFLCQAVGALWEVLEQKEDLSIIVNYTGVECHIGRQSPVER